MMITFAVHFKERMSEITRKFNFCPHVASFSVKHGIAGSYEKVNFEVWRRFKEEDEVHFEGDT
jgi:hypothetical protein